MADQTLAVFEPPQPNSGMPGGKFLEVRAVEGGWWAEWYALRDALAERPPEDRASIRSACLLKCRPPWCSAAACTSRATRW